MKSIYVTLCLLMVSNMFCMECVRGRDTNLDRISSLSFHPEEALLAVGGNQQNRGIMNAETKKWNVIWGYKFGFNINGVEFSPDGTQIKFQSTKRGLEVYPVERDFSCPVAYYDPKIGTDNELWNARFAPDGGLLLCRKDTLELYDKDKSEKPVVQINVQKYTGYDTTKFQCAAINRDYICAVAAISYNMSRSGSHTSIDFWDLRKKNIPFDSFEYKLDGVMKTLWFNEGTSLALMGEGAGVNAYNTKGEVLFKKRRDQSINDMAARGALFGIVSNDDGIELFDSEGNPRIAINKSDGDYHKTPICLALHQSLPLIAVARANNKVDTYECGAILS